MIAWYWVSPLETQNENGAAKQTPIGIVEGQKKKPTMVQDKITKWEAKDGKYVVCIILNLIYNVVLHASFAINSEEAFNHLINLNESECGKPNYT